MRYVVSVTQRLRYTENLVAEFDSLEDAGRFATTIVEHCEKASVTISIVNLSESEEVEE